MLMGKPDALNSSFHLGYNMLLNLLRVEGVDPEYLIKKSFHQFQSDKCVGSLLPVFLYLAFFFLHRLLPMKEKRLAELEKKVEQEMVIEGEEAVEEYYLLREQLQKLRQVFKDTVNQPIYCLPYLQPGRLVKVTEEQNDWGWGVITNFQVRSVLLSKHLHVSDATPNNRKKWVMMIEAWAAQDTILLTFCSTVLQPTLIRVQNHLNRDLALMEKVYIWMWSIQSTNELTQKKCPEGQFEVVPVLLPLISAISSVRISIPQDLRPTDARNGVAKTLQQVNKRFPDGIPLLDPIEDMQIQDEDFKKIIRVLRSLNPHFPHPLHPPLW